MTTLAPPPPRIPLGRGAAMNGRLHRARPIVIAACALLGLNAPAFAQSPNHAAWQSAPAWVSEIDFETGQFEIEVGSKDVPVGDLQACIVVRKPSTPTSQFPITNSHQCYLSDSTWRAGSFVVHTNFNQAQEEMGTFRIQKHREPGRGISDPDTVFSLVQWGGDSGPAVQPAVTRGVWSSVTDHIEKPKVSNESMQYANPHNVPPSPQVWFSGPKTLRSANTPVELVSFTAQGVQEGVLLRWRTASETANSGFRILRGNSENGPFQAVHNDLIPGQGSTPHATDYDYTDETAEPGALHYYQLEDMAHDGATERSATITARAGAPLPGTENGGRQG